MADLKLTKDGDLVIGKQEIDENGNALFYMGMSPEKLGVQTISPESTSYAISDAEIIDYLDYRVQLAQTILRTDNPDWSLYPTIGSNISELAGELNSQMTAQKGEEMITKAFMKTGTLSRSDIEVSSVPVSRKEILYSVNIQDNEAEKYTYDYVLDLDIGVLNYYEEKGEMYR